MSNSNTYINMSAKDALILAKNQHLLLPDIQREYVWTMEDIEKLFESIVDGYPVGSCIFWKTNRKTINDEKPNLYFFLREYESDKSKNEKAPDVLSEEGDYYIVLDGQQRITSLNIALYGYFTKFKGGRGHAKSDPKFWVKRELYYNLDFYNENTDEERDDEHPSKMFCFLSADEAKEGRFYRVKNLLAYDAHNDLLRWLFAEQYDVKVQNDLSKLYSRLHDPESSGLIHYYCISENSYDEALDIFVRVNSTGKKLSKSDLLFSTLIDGWKGGKESIDKALRSANSKGDGFNFTRDYLMRLLLVLVDAKTNLKIESFDMKTIQRIRDNWVDLSKAFLGMVDLLVAIGISDGFLTSYNSTMPLAYYLYRGGNLKSDDAKRECRKFLSISMAKRIFGVASNDALKKTRDAISAYDCKKQAFSLGMFDAVTLTGNRTFLVTESDIDYWLNTYTIGQNTYMILSLLYPKLKLSQVAFHQDHCHPYIGFEKKNLEAMGMKPETIDDWGKKRNLLPNLQFLEEGENKSKNRTPLKDWIGAGNTIAYMPSGISLELKDFEAFFEARRALIKAELLKVFNLP